MTTFVSSSSSASPLSFLAAAAFLAATSRAFFFLEDFGKGGKKGNKQMKAIKGALDM